MLQMSTLSKLTSVDSFEDITDPSCVVKCSGVSEFAYVLSFTTNEMSKKSWMKNCPQRADDDDGEAIRCVNDSLPPCKELTTFFTGRYKKALTEFYVGEKVVGFDDQVVFEYPDAIFLQRVSPKLKTFDMIFFYSTHHVVFSIVDKSDLASIRDWYEKKIYSCGIDPLPLKFVAKRLQFYSESGEKNIYDKVYEELFSVESEPSESEYEPSEDESESESELDLASEEEGCLDDRYDEEEDEEEEEEDEEDEWDPSSVAPADSDEEDYRSPKRQKI